MVDYHELRKKYPRWARRRDHHKKRKRKSRRKRKRRKKQQGQQNVQGSTTEGMLLSLLQQLMLGGTLAKKHGENVTTGYLDKVSPDALAPVRSRAAHRRAMRGAEGDGPFGAGAGAGAAAMIAPPAFPAE